MRMKKFCGLALVAALSTGVGATGLAAPASASPAEKPDTAQEVAAVVDAATPDNLEQGDVAATKKPSGEFAATGDAEVTIPATAGGKVSATSKSAVGGQDVTIEVGTGSSSDAAGEVAPNGSVVFDEKGSTDATVQVTEDGFRIHTVILDASAASRYSHEVSIPDGARLALTDTLTSKGQDKKAKNTGPGGALILDSQDKLLAGFSAPWATDANGAAVPTHYELEGNTLVQVIDHTSGNTAYPVVADPYLGFDMVSSARWAYHAGDGWTLEVTPTGWARLQAGGYIPGVYGWDELYAKYRNRGLNTNLDGMRDQYICHVQVVAIREPRKATWNLDEWRPNVSYLQTINARCNPGGSRIFD